jgi:hypothetical protein
MNELNNIPVRPRCIERVPDVCDREEPPNIKVKEDHAVRRVL